VLAALALPGCAGLDSVDTHFGRDAASHAMGINPGNNAGGAVIAAPFAILQVLYDFSQGY
jgi:hypothetical protein